MKKKILLILSSAVTTFTIATTQISAKPNSTQKETQNQTSFNATLSPRAKMANDLRWGHWNILKASNKKDDKLKSIAAVIKKLDYDLIGLTEVLDSSAIQSIVDHLNSIHGTKSYEYISSQKLKGKQASPGQAEHVGIIYKNDKLKPLPFVNNTIGYSYTSSFSHHPLTNAEYVRPPFGAQFEWKTRLKKDKLTFVFDHFDSPGAKNGEQTIHGMGAQEYVEAQQLPNVLLTFETMSQSKNIFFAGDTNIKVNKESIAFSNLNNYTKAFDDNLSNSTSLSDTPNQYSQPYDKIFYKTNLLLNQAFIYDLWNVKNDSQVNSYLSILKSAYLEPKKISDHAPIGVDIQG
ncbi:endonuclease/exonuclease/phosphatase family protein [Metamycoplasma arthritidis]|uniref:Membrane nuclease n=2 Tax=Metamycoplasma arthritidis TaxID=2111 RepID=B3PN81_META1|nr:endonuclease/exonuclease/phosphatase family protein [Metamycoplasma arthritidis]ACF07483.1 membrane nuclease [Metamycoplasma arthritidis 158L3-1]